MTTGYLAFTSGLGLLAVFFAAWARRIDNHGIIDVAWSWSFVVVAGYYAWLGAGWEPRRVMVVAMVGLWGARLGAHLARRVYRAHPQEDGRYQVLRERWGRTFHRKMVMLYLAQAMTVLWIAGPALALAQDPASHWRVVEWVGGGLWLVGWLGEMVADAQLSAFQRGTSGQGGVCRGGLWRFSRHPNYFFSWLCWVGLAVAASAAPGGGWAWLSPALLLYLLLFVSGVPPAEAQSLRTRGRAYRAYQQTTPAFFPWPPRRPGPPLP